MFLDFWMFFHTISSLTCSQNLSLRISCAFRISFSVSDKTSWNPQVLKSSLSLSSFKVTAPKSTTRIFLDLECAPMKIVHILWANCYAPSASGLYLILINFLTVTTMCFWKLWFRHFLPYTLLLSLGERSSSLLIVNSPCLNFVWTA